VHCGLPPLAAELRTSLEVRLGAKGRHASSKTKGSVNLLNDLPYGAAVVTAEKVAIETVKRRVMAINVANDHASLLIPKTPFQISD
jgi:hypothetical protein